MADRLKSAAWAGIALSFLAGCVTSQSSYNPADIPPVYKIRNSPLPVPDPKWNPRRNHQVASATAAQTRTQAAPVARVSAPPQSPPNPSGTVHTVSRGETLYAISRKYGVPVRSFISVNNLRAPYTLAVGQRLSVPVTWVHVVKKGDTGYSISRKYGVNVSALMRVNGIKPPYSLAVGQRLKLPGGAGPSVTETASSSSPSRASSSPARGRTVAIPKPPPRTSKGFIWPVKGKLASRYGPKEGGIHNDGINILASQGSPVRVAEAGVVVYASNALQGYGNLLLVKHAGGWITAYAHNERILVRPGQQVGKGDIVARVGNTGGVSSPQLHFEIRKGKQALDPLKYLSG